MLHLIAQGEQPEQRWRRELAIGRDVILGRTGPSWDVPWDSRVSRRHALLLAANRSIHVRRLAESTNPIFYRGQAADEFEMPVGDHFVIGGTSFELVEGTLGVTLEAPLPRTEQTFSRRMLASIPYTNAARQMDAVSRLPEIIQDAANDDDLCVRLIGILFHAVESATFVAVVASAGTAADVPLSILHWDSRPATEVATEPSERLIRQAISAQESIAHIWNAEESSSSADFTQSAGADWAFCTPVRGHASRGWALYVSGKGELRSAHPGDSSELRDAVKFAELVAISLGNLRDLQQLEGHKSVLRQFLSPVVLEAATGNDPDAILTPREADVSVLFCDLRGFSATSEQSAGDLRGLLDRVSNALGVMTQQILAFDGVIGDFHGDAAMGFWGWPLEQASTVELACSAALGILRDFTSGAGQQGKLSDFRVGIGIASGPAVAGKIGTIDQVKVTVFGPVVNLASRLEEMTKLLRAPILIDEATAAIVRQSVPEEVARVRRVARVRPYGLENDLEVSQLLPPAEVCPELSDDDIRAYEASLDQLQQGNWESAFQLLHSVPATDRVKDFLTVFIAQNNRTPPAGWDGVIPLDGKR